MHNLLLILINYFKSKQLEDANFFYTFKLDDESRLPNVFWRDGVSGLPDECFFVLHLHIEQINGT